MGTTSHSSSSIRDQLPLSLFGHRWPEGPDPHSADADTGQRREAADNAANTRTGEQEAIGTGPGLNRGLAPDDQLQRGRQWQCSGGLRAERVLEGRPEEQRQETPSTAEAQAD